MLVLSRKQGESLYIGDKIRVQVAVVKGQQVKLAFDAPKEVRVQKVTREHDQTERRD